MSSKSDAEAGAGGEEENESAAEADGEISRRLQRQEPIVIQSPKLTR